MIPLLFALMLPTNPPEVIPPPTPELREGYYACSGKVNGKTYNSVVIIEARGDSYVVVWANGAEPQIGVGMRVGNRLIIGFNAGKLLGVAEYNIGAKVLEGYWTALPGDGAKKVESLTFLRELKKE